MKIGLVAFCSIVILFSCSPKLSPDNNWAEGLWILTELKEVPVQISGNTHKDAHIEFMPPQKNTRVLAVVIASPAPIQLVQIKLILHLLV
jgi:hypothetical protein